MTLIQAKVNPRLLGKAARLFTGTLSGRVTELLQNARRAGARRVEIVNRDGLVILRDDGRGIDDFATLLDLGGSGWDEKLEQSEDPAGVGLFCLSPRPLTVRSRGQCVTIDEKVWTGAAAEVRGDSGPLPATAGGIPAGVGTELSFADEPWDAAQVKPLAAYTELDVIVDAERCPQERFIDAEASLHLELGCRIKVVKVTELTTGHRTAVQMRDHRASVLVNFHGQVISFDYQPVNGHDLAYLVDLTGTPTALRLMLPARTCLIENDAFKQLKAVLELEAFRYLQRLGHHRLPYSQYLRAGELGVTLPEAEPCFHVGLLMANLGPEPVEVRKPPDQPLARCYRLADVADGSESDEANVHLLAALGRFDDPFIPVEIRKEYDGYSWAALATVQGVEFSCAAALHESWLSGGKLTCAESLTLTAHCSDGKTFSSMVPMAVKPQDESSKPSSWNSDCEVFVTPAARTALLSEQIWYHLGGVSDEGDTYETQEYDFKRQLDDFWMALDGPHEILRNKLMSCAADLETGWKSVKIEPEGRVVIQRADGTEQSIAPPRRVTENSAAL